MLHIPHKPMKRSEKAIIPNCQPNNSGNRCALGSVPGRVATTMRTIRLPMFRLVRRAVIIRRMYSVPENITMFSAGAAAIGAVYPMIMAHTGGHGLPCPLRTLTGVPCPFCGLTTATVALAHGEWAAAAKTSPLAYLVAILAVGTAPVLVARVFGLAPLPRPASGVSRRRVSKVMIVIVGLSWLFQLHRYGFI